MLEASAELLQEIPRPRVAVGLKDHNDPIFGEAPVGGFEYRGDLRRVMAVVVEDPHAFPLSFELEAPLDSLEGGEALPYRLQRHLEFKGRGDRRKAVQDVVLSRQRDGELTQGSPAQRHLKSHPRA